MSGVNFAGIKKYFKSLRGSRYKFGSNIENDWLITIIIFILLSLGMFFVNNEFKSLIVKDELISGTTVITNQELDLSAEEVVVEVFDFYKKKIDNTKDLLEKPPQIIDPLE